MNANRSDTQAVVPLLQWIRGMCSDEEPHHVIDAMLSIAIDAADRDAARIRLAEDIIRMAEKVSKNGGDSTSILRSYAYFGDHDGC